MQLPQKGEVLSSRYEIRELLGEGAMGRVYLALDRERGTEVAVKVMKAEAAADPMRMRRFEREIMTLRRIDHPNILRYLDHGRHGDIVFLTVELLKGRPLDRAAPDLRAQAERVLRLGARLARAFFAAHEKGIIHRDIKPANILITDEGDPKILDYGLARWEPGTDGGSTTATMERLTQTDAVLGTIPYMSPEQIRAEKVDRRSDIYSLAVVLYELASGSRPYSAPSIQDQVRLMDLGTPRELHEVDPALDTPAGHALDTVLRRALDPLPQRRFQSMDELALALEKGADLGASIPRDATSAILLPPAPVRADLDLSSLYGREGELEIGDRVLRGARSGLATGLVIEAPRGMGKSLLASELVRLAHRQGWLCLASSSASGRPVSSWLSRAREIFPSDAAVAVALEAARTGETGPALLEPLGRAVVSLAVRMPVLLLLEDAHENLEAVPHLTALLDTCAAQRLAQIVTLRSDVWLSEEDARILDDFLARARVERVVLPPLGGAALRLMAEEAYPGLEIPAEVVPRLVERSGGNPAHAREILALLVERGEIHREGPDWAGGEIRDLPFPPGARAALLSRIGPLEVDSVALLESAAVLGSRFDVATLAEVLGLDAASLEIRLDALAGRGRPLDRDGDGFCFDPPLDREMLLERIDPERRKGLHLRAAEAISMRLHGDPDPLTTGALANHYLDAGRIDEGIPYVAATALLLHGAGVPEASIPWLDRARTLLGQRIEAVEEEARVPLRIQLAEIHLCYGEALDACARHADALEHLDLARSLAIATHRLDLQARSLIGMSRAFIARGDVLQAQRRAKDAEKLSRAADGAERALALSAEAQALSLGGEIQDAEEKWAQAVATLEALGLKEDAAEAHFRLANHYFRLGKYDLAERGYEAAAAHASREENPRLHARILNAQAAVILAHKRPAEALPRFEEAATIRREVGYKSGEATSLHNIAYCHHLLGNWSEALRMYGRVTTIRRELGEVSHRGRAQRQYAEVLLDLGRIEEALEEARDALAAMRQVEDLGYAPPCLTLLGEIELQLGRSEKARDAFGEVVREFQGHDQDWALDAALGLAQADWLARQTASAARRFEEILRDQPGGGTPIGPHWLYRILLALKENGAAGERLREVASLLIDSPGDDLPEAKMWSARVRALLLEVEGRAADGEGHLALALEISERLGSVERTWRLNRDLALLKPEGSTERAAKLGIAREIVESQARAFRQEELRRAYLAQRERDELLRAEFR